MKRPFVKQTRCENGGRGVNLKIYPPSPENCQSSEWTLCFSMRSMRAHYVFCSTLKQKLEMLYSFTFYKALYIYLLSELCHLELSKWTGQSCISFYAKFLSIAWWFFIMLLLLLCSITPQHIYVVVVVVVVYYTSRTITTTRFIEIDYEVCVK